MDDDKPDIEIAALGNGCLTGCGAGCGSIVLVLGIAIAAGINIAQLTPDTIPGWLRFIGFVTGLGTDVLVGYTTARAAPHAPVFHALLIGIIFMLFGVLGIVLPAGHSFSGQAPDFWLIASWLLTIPMMLWGANIWERQNYNRD